MACLSKNEWLKERHLDIEWAPAGVPKLIHVDNGKEFHSLALRRGCERYGISLEYNNLRAGPNFWCSHRALSRYAHAENSRTAGNHVLEPDRAR